MAKTINETNIEKTKQIIKKSDVPISVLSQSEEYNRKILEYGKFHLFIVDFNKLINLKDSLRQVNSGFNHVIAKIALKNSVSISFDLSMLSKLNKKQKAIALTKTKQIVEICRKAKTPIKLINAKDKKDAFSFLLSLGSSTTQAKEAIYF